jgi:uncharacterized protein (DUF1015 family)
MADVVPLRPLRYATRDLARVVAPPYDVVDARLRAELAARDPYNVVHIDLPEGAGDQRYEHARELFERWQREGVLRRDERPAFYRYVQRFVPPGGGAPKTRVGVFGGVRAVPFSSRVVLPHERTLAAPKLDRLKLWRATQAALSPGMMLYFGAGEVLDRALEGAEPLAEFATPDGVEHGLERVVDPARLAAVTTALAPRTLVIADGHHRYSTAVGLCDEIVEELGHDGGALSSDAECWFFPALLVDGDAPSLVIYPTHRVLSGLADFDFSRLLAGAEELFRVEPTPARLEQLQARLAAAPDNAFALLAATGAAMFAPRADASAHASLSHRPQVLRRVAAILLHDVLLDPLGGPEKVVEYEQDARVAVERVKRGDADLCALMKPMPVRALRAVAEAGEVLPPKSTFFYPKVPTGLLFHRLGRERVG